MFKGSVHAVRRAGSGISWRQWITVLSGIAVIGAMVFVAERARSSEERHRRDQVLVERVRAASQELNSVNWEALWRMSRDGPRSVMRDGGLVRRGFASWNDMHSALTRLEHADGGEIARLQDDADALYSVGMNAFKVYMRGDVKTAMRVETESFHPALNKLDADSLRAVAAQEDIAETSELHARIAYLASLFLGLAALLLLGARLHRLSRRALIASERRASERRSEARVRALVEHSSDVISVIDRDLNFRWQSPSMQRMLGHDTAGLLDRRLTTLVHPEDVALVENHLRAATGRTGTSTFSARFRHADGDWRHLETVAENRLSDPAVEGVILNMRDVTERKLLEDELRHQAFHDSLTGLANRALFEDRLRHALAAARRHGHPFAVLFLDLDDFKTINDSLGHAHGDELLRAVALRIGTVVRPTDTAARLGGDEFAILIEVMEDEGDADLVAGRILEALEPGFEVAGRELRVRGSVGVAVGDGSLGADELLRNADTAMYAAKEQGKNTVETFEPGMHRRVLDRLELSGQLQRALERDEFELDYQPIIELDSGRIAGAEALVRWAHPERGRLAPLHFIGHAEETGLIVQLGAWILRTACARAVEWHNAFPGREPLYISVNVSTRQLQERDFTTLVAEVLESTGLDPKLLTLEITESLVADERDEVMRTLDELKALGVRVAVDDFGTGYSALSRLQHFPIDVIKIDRSFVDGIEEDESKAQLVRGIINLGESLKLDIVAEGIEHEEQAARLRAMRSHFGQGYLFSRPVGEAEMRAMLSADEALHKAA